MSEDQKPIAGGEPPPAAEDRAQALIGKTLLLRYRVEELVAMGGIGAVFRATQLSTGDDVAIKVLHPEAEGLPELITRFEREAIAGKHIFSPNVAAVHEFSQLDDGTYVLVQEFIRGRTLRDIIDEGPMPPLRAAKIARQLSVALAAAHDLGILHRDLKPRNIMILDGKSASPGSRRPGQEGEDHVLLIDFGLAKVPVDRLDVGTGRESLTQAGVVLGTVAYLAPEAALGMRSVDRRSDLYALGLVLYEMLAGRHPFSAADAAGMFSQQRKAVPPPFGERTPGVVVPAKLEEVTRRLLEKDPDVRYQEARAVGVALDQAIEAMGKGPSAPDLASPASTALAETGSKPPWIVIGVAVVLALGVAAFLLLR